MQSILHPAGPDAALIAEMAWLLFGGGTAIFVAVMWLLALALRRRGRGAPAMVWILGGGIAFPVVVLSALLAFSTWRSAQLTPQTSLKALAVAVTGKMWWWEVRYADPAGGPDVVLANELHIPVGRPVYLALSSSDVIHSFWVPALAGKMDMVPGRVNGLVLRAATPGVYRGQCAEYCGEQHARMAFRVVAHSEADYAAWLARERRPAAPLPEKRSDDATDSRSAQLLRGRDVFVAQRCGACHTVRGLSETAALGPDLTHVGSRSHLGAGTLRNHADALAAWIADPQTIKRGARMPATRLGEADLHALTAYLEHLK